VTADVKTIRDIFIEEIYRRMYDNDEILFLSADFGAPKLDILREKFPDRFVNVGIAEQNLVNVATGLALEGYCIFAYAIAPFLTMRAYEQIRVNLSLQAQIRDLNVNLIGVGAGLSYDVSGPTHHCLEDLSIMRTLPNMVVFSPSDWMLAHKFVEYSIDVKKPKYLRFDGKPVSQIYQNLNDISIDTGFFELHEGKTICLISTGNMTHKAINIAKRCADEGISIGVIDVFLLKPFKERIFYEIIKKYDIVISLEEGFINKGGLDSLISTILDSNNSDIRLFRMGFDDKYVFEIGNRDYLHKLCSLDDDCIIVKIKKLIKEF